VDEFLLDAFKHNNDIKFKIVASTSSSMLGNNRFGNFHVTIGSIEFRENSYVG